MPTPSRLLGTQLSEQQRSIPALSHSTDSLLICGEEGTGKSLFAAHIHAGGPLGQKPLLSVNVATTSERDRRLALFGSSYAQMNSTKRSLLEQKTTVLIKHIDYGETWLQDALVAAFRTGSFKRPGSRKETALACRAIFTLRKSPEELHGEGKLSASLSLYLSAMQRLLIPPLRERPDDIIAIAQDFLGLPLGGDLCHLLLTHRWPANGTELKAHLSCLKALPWKGDVRDDCRRELAKMILRIEEGEDVSLRNSLSFIENNLIQYALRRTDGHRGRAAQLLGISEPKLRWRIDRLRTFG